MNQTPIPANLPLTVTLEAQAWNSVLAALGKLPYEVVAPLIHSMTEQLQRGAAAAQVSTITQPSVAGNGVDSHPWQGR